MKKQLNEKSEKWIQKAIKHPGALKKSLHVAADKPIPADKLEKATHSKNPTLKKRATLAQTLKGLHEDETKAKSKPDYLDFDKDGDKSEPMKAALKDKQKVKEGSVEESGLQAYLGNKKYGKEGMNALRKAGKDGASKEKMNKLRARFDKLDEIVSDTPEPKAGSKSGIPTSATTTVPGMRATPADLRKANSSVVIGEEEYKASVDKSKIPAHLRKAKGGDWKLSTKDLEDEASKSPTSAAGLAKLKKRLGMNENVKVEKMKSKYENSGNFHKVKDMNKKFESSYTPNDADNPTQKKSKANHAYGNLKVELIKEDAQFEAWENQFQSFLTEEISISTTHNTGHKSDNGSGMNIPEPEDSVNISARGEDAQALMKLLRNAGMMGDNGDDHEEKGHDIELDSPAGDTATVSLGSDDDYEQEQGAEEHEHGDGYGTLQVIHPSDSGEMFAGDDKPSSHGDMMKDLLDKLTGIGAPDMSDDSDDKDDEHDSEEDSDDEEDSDEEETSEGNMFTGNLAKARAAGKKTADLDGDGDEEPVKEESDAERDDKAEAAGKKVAKDIEYDDKKDEEEKDEEKVNESDEACNECGMYESDCGCDHEKIDETDDGAVAHGYEQEEEYVSEGVGMIGTNSEGLENGADDQATQDLDFMTKVISGGLNKQKINQHVHPYNNPGPGLSESANDLLKPVSMKDILDRLTKLQ